MSQDNINELLNLLGSSENILRYNSIIEDDITNNGGTVLYSYNNIIIASEISDEIYTKLQNDNHIEYIQDLPLKKYGDVDVNLINQFDAARITTISNVSGNTVSISGIPPTIYNDIFTLTALTNDTFNYIMKASGSLPITYEFITPINYYDDLSLKNFNTIEGKSSNVGIFGITFKAHNNYGTDTKKLILTIIENVKITNTIFDVYNKLGTFFSYVIESIGPYPKYYSVTPNLPAGVYLDNNIISGTFTTGGTYVMSIGVSGITSSDSKTLTINVGVAPIITSFGELIVEENASVNYTITSTLITDVTYNIIGALPIGFSFDGIDTISGTALVKGSYSVTLKAYNGFGENLKKLKIVVYDMDFNKTTTTTTTTFTPITTTTTTTMLPTTTILPTTTLPPMFGDLYEGGIISYIFEPGDPGYVEGETHGLITALEDVLPIGYTWGTTGHTETILTIGSGLNNTNLLINLSTGYTNEFLPAHACVNYSGNGYTDWFLPSLQEIKYFSLLLWAGTGITPESGGFVSEPGLTYWSSSEVWIDYDDEEDQAFGYFVDFDDSSQWNNGNPYWLYFDDNSRSDINKKTRPIRYF